MKPKKQPKAGFARSGEKVLRGSATAAIALALSGPVQAAEVTLNAADAFGLSSFELAGGWSNAAAPSAANDYTVAITRLRTPADSLPHTFAGNSLKISTTAGNLTYKGLGSYTITVPNLILDGGLIDHLQGSADVFTLAGNLTVTGTGSRIAASQGPIIVTSIVNGTGDLAINNNLVTTFASANTYTGTITVNGAFVLADTGSLSFKIGATGVNNTITGAGPATFNGAFNLDLATAGNTIGNNWTLVNVGTVVETFGATFNIPGFTENDNVWTSADGRYQFVEATGVLSRISGDTDGDGLPDIWEMQYFSSLDESGSTDFDGDLASNLLEYLDGSDPTENDPTDPTSFPDTDNDGLNDGWELNYFTNLAQTGEGDPDADYNTTLVEFLAGTNPNLDVSYPDTEDGVGDTLNDGWEIHFFGNITSYGPGDDPDGDLFTNNEEFLSKTDPTDQKSSPDSDGDGLPDGWEIFYFKVGEESLAETIARQDGNGDPDGDHVSNTFEFRAATDPTDPASKDPTVGYWRFEEMLAGEVPAGGNGVYAFPTSVTDSSAYGNPMMAWADYVRPNYEAVVPAETVPATGAANTASLYFLRNTSGIYFIESVFTTPPNYLPVGQGSLRTQTFSEFTVEATFKTSLAGAWQVPVCKVGNPVGGQPPFSMKIDTTNKLRAGLVDGSGVAREIIGTSTVAAGSWYSAAVTATPTQMTLWLKKPGDFGYSIEGTVTIAGAWYVPAAGPLDTAWQVGAGVWNGGATDGFQGNIDEVRISASVLAADQFLFHTVGSAYDTWATTNIPDAAKRGQTDDADRDGTNNMTEYRLGLSPTSGSSMFLATRAANGQLTWPSTVGVTFTVQRSTSLAIGSWSTVGTVPGTAGSATFSDPSPLPGNAFYRVLLEP